eukprot:s2533_g4.t1
MEPLGCSEATTLKGATGAGWLCQGLGAWWLNARGKVKTLHQAYVKQELPVNWRARARTLQLAEILPLGDLVAVRFWLS